MKQQSTVFSRGRGWQVPPDRSLDGPQTLVLVFAAPGFGDDAAFFDELAAQFPQALVAGCSTAGEIAGAQVHDEVASVAIARFDHTRLALAATPVAAMAESFDAGARLALQLAGPGLRAVFVLSDGLAVNGTQLVDGLVRHLGPGVVVTGGLAGDGARFGHTWVLDGGRPRAGQVAAIGFYGERLVVGHGCDAGWSDFGPERRITRAEGNVLHELDGRPALELYKTYLGERAAGLPGTALLFPLAVREAAPGALPVVRTVLAVDEAAGTMTFAGDLPEGGVARLMRANTDRLVASAALAARHAVRPLPAAGDALVVSVSCVGRRLVLGERTDDEIESVLDHAPRGSAHVGFYSYGEISPALEGGASALHNQTMTITAFGER